MIEEKKILISLIKEFMKKSKDSESRVKGLLKANSVNSLDDCMSVITLEKLLEVEILMSEKKEALKPNHKLLKYDRA
jgi:hypothetical protein